MKVSVLTIRNNFCPLSAPVTPGLGCVCVSTGYILKIKNFNYTIFLVLKTNMHLKTHLIIFTEEKINESYEENGALVTSVCQENSSHAQTVCNNGAASRHTPISFHFCHSQSSCGRINAEITEFSFSISEQTFLPAGKKLSFIKNKSM